MKRFSHRSLIARTIVIVVSVAVFCFLLFITNYGIRQKYSEFRVAHEMWKILQEQNAADFDDFATIMGIAHKESQFWGTRDFPSKKTLDGLLDGFKLIQGFPRLIGSGY